MYYICLPTYNCNIINVNCKYENKYNENFIVNKLLYKYLQNIENSIAKKVNLSEDVFLFNKHNVIFDIRIYNLFMLINKNFFFNINTFSINWNKLTEQTCAENTTHITHTQTENTTHTTHTENTTCTKDNIIILNQIIKKKYFNIIYIIINFFEFLNVIEHIQNVNNIFLLNEDKLLKYFTFFFNSANINLIDLFTTNNQINFKQLKQLFTAENSYLLQNQQKKKINLIIYNVYDWDNFYHCQNLIKLLMKQRNQYNLIIKTNNINNNKCVQFIYLLSCLFEKVSIIQPFLTNIINDIKYIKCYRYNVSKSKCIKFNKNIHNENITHCTDCNIINDDINKNKIKHTIRLKREYADYNRKNMFSCSQNIISSIIDKAIPLFLQNIVNEFDFITTKKIIDYYNYYLYIINKEESHNKESIYIHNTKLIQQLNILLEKYNIQLIHFFDIKILGVDIDMLFANNTDETLPLQLPPLTFTLQEDSPPC